MAKPATKHLDIKDLSFEKALKELESIVGRLERGDVELEESINIYERGEALKDRLLKSRPGQGRELTFNQAGSPPAPSLRSPQGEEPATLGLWR